MKTGSGKAVCPNLICILPAPKYSLKTGPSPTPTNIGGFPNLRPINREGGRSVVLYLTDPHHPKKDEQGGGIFTSTLHVSPEKRQKGDNFFEHRPVFPNNIGGERGRSKESDPIYRKIKREEGTGVEPCPHFTCFHV